MPRKNRKAVVETFVALQRRATESGTQPVVNRLILVGPELPPELAGLANGVADRIMVLQDLSHQELRAC